MLKKIYYSVILFGCGTKTSGFLNTLFYNDTTADSYQVSFGEKIQYLTKLLLTFTPFAFMLEKFNLWLPNNQIFFRTIVYALFANVIVGGWFHYKNKSFKWRIFFRKNIEMWLIILLVYPILEGMKGVTGDNVIGEFFKIAIQLGTLIYPASKVFKNIHILSNKKFPPSFIMDKVYNFEKDGNVKDFFESEGNKTNNNQNQE